MRSRRRFDRDTLGRFHPNLEVHEREVLADLPGQAMGLLSGEDPVSARLYPVAYPDDPQAQADYRSVMEKSLQAKHRAALDTLATSAGDESLDEEQLQLWMAALEVLRLVLGTELDVSEDMEEIDSLDPRGSQFAMYAYLSMLQGEIIDALSATLPVVADEEPK